MSKLDNNEAILTDEGDGSLKHPETTEPEVIGDKYEIPAPDPVSTTSNFAALKERIRHHYELASDYYYSLW